MKLKYTLSKLEKALVFQVLEMDERFRSRADVGGILCRAKNEMWVRSMDTPEIRGVEIFLRGESKEGDDSIEILEFDTNKQRDKIFNRIQEALADWAENWEGFQEDKKTAFWSKERPKENGHYVVLDLNGRGCDYPDPEIRYLSPGVPDRNYASVICWGPKIPYFPEEKQSKQSKQPGKGTFVLE